MAYLQLVHGNAESAMLLMDEDTIKCSRCADPTPESEVMEVGAWWVCGMCYDDL
jgi:formylmethanofuran dehydrogenase subunit E